MKFRTLLCAAALAASALVGSAAGAASQVRSGVADGLAYEYKSSIDETGALRLIGRDPRTGEQFAFKARSDGRVSGYVNGRPVDFRVKREHVENALRDARQR